MRRLVRPLAQMRSEHRFSDLYTAHAPDAFRLAYLLTRDRDAAADIVQDAFIRLLGRFADLRDRGAFAAYLRRTVINLATDRGRRLRAERARDERHRAIASREPGGFPDVETQETIGRALRSLPPRQQAVLVLRYVEDLSERQIAEAMRCSVSAVKGLTSRGLRSLEQQLEGEG